MTALSAAQQIKSKGPINTQAYPVKASQTVYGGGLVMLDTTGYAVAAATGSTSNRVVGVARESVTDAGSGTDKVEVMEGQFLLTGATLAQADVGRPCYVVDDDSIDETPGIGTIPAGIIREYVSATQAWVEVSPIASAAYEPVIQWHHIQSILCATIADGDLVTTWTPGFVGELLGFTAQVSAAVSTASKASTLNLEIGTTNCTGGALALTSANLATLGARVNATAFTAGTIFGQADTISVEAASTTTFIEGSIDLFIKARQFVGAAV